MGEPALVHRFLYYIFSKFHYMIRKIKRELSFWKKLLDKQWKREYCENVIQEINGKTFVEKNL